MAENYKAILGNNQMQVVSLIL